MKVNILGQEYNIVTDDGLRDVSQDGCCDVIEKTISVRSVENMLEHNQSHQGKERYYKEVLRHEIVHAFFSESGMAEYSNDELLVDWIAVQFPKMLDAFREVKCIADYRMKIAADFITAGEIGTDTITVDTELTDKKATSEQVEDAVKRIVRKAREIGSGF